MTDPDMHATTTSVPTVGLKAQVVSSLRWAVVAKFGAQLVSWAITLVVMRLLTPDAYGLTAMLTIIFGFVGMLGDMGFGSSLIQSPTINREVIRQTYGASLLANCIICVLLFAAAPLIAAFYNEPRLVSLAEVASLGFITNAFSVVSESLLRRELRFKVLASVEIATNFVIGASTLVMAWWGLGVWALVLGSLGGSVARVVILNIVSPVRCAPAFSFKGARTMWAFGTNVTITRIVWYWTVQVDVLIAGKLLGKEALGLYSVALNLASLPMQRTLGLINSVAFPAFAKIQGDREALRINVALAVRLMALLSFPVLWGIGSVAPELVRVVLGEKWQQAVFPLTVVAFTIPLRMIGSVVSTTVMSIGRADIAMITTIMGAIIMPPIFYFGARDGIEGLSLAWLAITPIMFLLNMYRALPELGLTMRKVLAELARPAATALLMSLSVLLARALSSGLSDVQRFIMLIAVGAVTWICATWFINRSATVEALALLFPGRFANLARRHPARS